MRRDDQRRSDINSLYYNLEEIYFAKNKLYPITLSEENLPGIDDVAFKDTNDVLINQDNSEYQYKPLDCSKAGCKGYTLRADLENEADFVKNNR